MITTLSITHTYKKVLEGLNLYYTTKGSNKPITIYAEGEMPTSELPEVFIELLENGSLKGRGSELGLLNQSLLLTLYIKTQPNGVKNKIREEFILKQINDIIINGVFENSFLFKINKDNMFVTSINLKAGYSNKSFNIKVTIFNN